MSPMESVVKDTKIVKLFQEKNITKRTSGYYYLGALIQEASKAVNELPAIGKLRDIVAAKFNSTPARVERSVRHLVQESSGIKTSQLFFVREMAEAYLNMPDETPRTTF